jgi:predicted nucleotidyltransferase
MKIIDGVIPKEKDKIISLILALFPGAKIYLYGSRAKGNFMEWSDIDLAIDVGKKIENLDKYEINSILEASNTPYKASVVDVNGVNEEFRQEIFERGCLWTK